MSNGQQSQKAGSNSQQLQVYGNYYANGLTEERAIEIYDGLTENLVERFSAESLEIARQRFQHLEDHVIPKLVEAKLLGVLADPAYQVTLSKAQIGAASTERGSDYELLANLLLDRAVNIDDRKAKAGINRALEMVDQLDSDALTGLTVYSIATQFYSSGITLDVALTLTESLLEQVIEGQTLPEGNGWIENLEIVGAVRVDEVRQFGPFDQYWARGFSDHLSSGVEIGSEREQEGTHQLTALGFQAKTEPGGAVGLTTLHELKPGYLRWDDFNSERLFAEHKLRGGSENQIQQATQIGRAVYGSDTVDNALIPTFMELVRLRPYQKLFGEWWNALNPFFVVSPVGKILARANARNRDALGIIPPLK